MADLTRDGDGMIYADWGDRRPGAILRNTGATTGPPGAGGTPGADGQSVNPRGPWGDGIVYSRLDTVLNASSDGGDGNTYTYIAASPSATARPNTAAGSQYWVIVGERGATGPTGPAGTSEGGTGGEAPTETIRWADPSDWHSTGILYEVGSTVQQGGSGYYCKVRNRSASGTNKTGSLWLVGKPEDNPDVWQMFAKRGTDGARGVKGEQGDKGPAGAAGAKGDAGAAGAAGAKGDTGPAGAAYSGPAPVNGTDGKDAFLQVSLPFNSNTMYPYKTPAGVNARIVSSDPYSGPGASEFRMRFERDGDIVQIPFTLNSGQLLLIYGEGLTSNHWVLASLTLERA